MFDFSGGLIYPGLWDFDPELTRYPGLWRDCVVCSVLGQQYPPVNLVDGNIMPLDTAFYSYGSEINKFGPAFGKTGGPATLDVAISSIPFDFNNSTILCVFGSMSDFSSVFSHSAPNGDHIRFVPAGGQQRFRRRVGGSNLDVSNLGSASVPNGFLVTMDYSATTKIEIRDVVNGGIVGTSTGGNTATESTADVAFHYAGQLANLLVMWNRVLSVKEREILEQDFFSMVRPDPSKIVPLYFPASASGATLSPITETDTALPLSAARVRALSPIAEVDAAVALSAARARTLDAVAETDIPVALSTARVQSLGVAEETDTALPLSTSSGTTLDPATETDTALPLSTARVRTLSPIAETDSAVALSTARARTLDAVAETDSPVALTGKRVQTLGVAAETDTALPLSTGDGTFEDDVVRFAVDLPAIRATATIGAIRATISRAA